MRRSLNQLKKVVFLTFFGLLLSGNLFAGDEPVEQLDMDIVLYEDILRGDSDALGLLERALHDKGIVGVRGIPGYQEKVQDLIDTAIEFSALPEEVKETYAPRGEIFLGYERGKEKFQRPDGTWVIDDLKVSYYGFVPDNPNNKWPVEVDLKSPFQELGMLMSEIGELVMLRIGLIGENTGIYLEEAPRLGRMLYYCKNQKTSDDNPYWCGSHFDHSLFTALLPAFYFVDGKQIAEPEEAGLFVKTDGKFKKVVANDRDVMMFQVGEFAQLILNDQIRATEHRVHKALGSVERYTMALFCDAPMETVIHSTSELTCDSRYGGEAGDPCSYRNWNERTFERYIVRDE